MDNIKKLSDLYRSVQKKKDYKLYLEKAIRYSSNIKNCTLPDVSNYSNTKIEKENILFIKQLADNKKYINDDLNRDFKKNHWNWYIFSNTYKSSDGAQNKYFSYKTDDDLICFLDNCDLAERIRILNAILTKTTKDGTTKWSNFMPGDDHDRMAKSIIFWLSQKILYQDKYNDYRLALINLAKNYNVGASASASGGTGVSASVMHKKKVPITSTNNIIKYLGFLGLLGMIGLSAHNNKKIIKFFTKKYLKYKHKYMLLKKSIN